MASAQSVKTRIERLTDDPEIPDDVSHKMREAVDELGGEGELSVRANSAASILQEIGNDPNISQHMRTEVWNLASKVENLEG
jgi:Uncharacterized protein conserved in archaea|nr:MAG: uncharacterized protein conserved in archaea [Candidatus Nanosalinarum sp. J07AB56]